MKSDLLRSLGPATQLMMVILIAFITTFLMTITAFLVIRPIWQVNVFEDSEMLSKLPDLASVHIVKVLQIFNQLGMFLLPALIFKNLFSSAEKPFFVLKKNHRPSIWLFSAIALIIAFPLVNYLHWINIQIPFTQNMASDDKEATEFTVKLLSGDGVLFFLVNLFIYALLPALAEEFFFRGVVLRQVALSTKNIHLAVWVSAALFSFIHSQPSFFIPRLVMGAALGYVFVWSGSIWLGVLMHFINNFLVVGIIHSIINYDLDPSIEALGMNEGEIGLVLLSLVFTSGIFFYLYKKRNDAYRNFMIDYYREENERLMRKDEEEDDV